MNILFISDRKDHQVSYPTVGSKTGKEYVKTYIEKTKIYSADFETPTLHARTRNALLLSLNNHVDNFIIVIDLTSIPLNKIISQETLKGRTMLAHNAKFEYSWFYSNGLDPEYIFCTMIAEQKILQGSAVSMSLESICERRKIGGTFDKDIRDRFIGASLSIIFTDEEIEYSAVDVKYLLELKDLQEEIIRKSNLEFYIYSIHMRLVKELAKSELTGFVCNTEKWMGFIQEIEVEVNILIAKLDKFLDGVDLKGINGKREGKETQVLRLRERIRKNLEKVKDLEEKGKTHLKVYESTVGVLERAKIQLEEVSNKLEQTEPLINWNSGKQVLEVFSRKGVDPLPLSKDQETHKYKPGVSKEARNVWLAENQEAEHLEFFKVFHEFMNTKHLVSAFGQKWVDKYVQEDRKVYTVFRQASSSTGRFTCGDKDHNLFNLQQTPTKTKEIEGENIAVLRESLGTDPGRSVATLDYKGCEIMCMVGLSGDLSLKKIADLPDQHSYLGTLCWRNVYTHRYKKTKDPKYLELSTSYEMKPGKERTKFKNSGAFPVIYGVYSTKVAAIQGFTKEEGQIFIDTIEGEMPKVVSFVKDKASQAISTGKVLHNTRTNSYRVFDKVIEKFIYDVPLSFMDEVDIRSAARNSPIQGTNADIICEAIIWIGRWAKWNKVDLRLLGQVHDELIYDFPSDQLWIANKIKALMCKCANTYLIPEISMEADCIIKDTWAK